MKVYVLLSRFSCPTAPRNKFKFARTASRRQTISHGRDRPIPGFLRVDRISTWGPERRVHFAALPPRWRCLTFGLIPSRQLNEEARNACSCR